MSNELQKPIIGFTSGDINGIGLEILIKTLSDSRMLDVCTPIVFANNKSINFYKKNLPDYHFSYQNLKEISKPNPKQVNIFNCWEEEVSITPGVLNETGGKYALLSLERCTQALKSGEIDAMVTAPIHKKNIQSTSFQHSGHTPYLKAAFEAKEILMFMVAENMRVGLLTEHVPVQEVSKHVTQANIISKLKLMNQSLQKDFGVNKPRLAVLALNPHAGDDGLIGKEEETVIKPAIKEAKQQLMVFGPYPADAFFTRGQYENFDGVLAMYHDQGLIPFKSLAIGEGTNYTAGLPVVRTSPDHGTAFDIAGKGIADPSSFYAATFEAIDIVRRRNGWASARANPLRKMSGRMLANAIDEKIED
jgi:4-hydroxythreonine-4-phosphate dehydrogenase